MKFVLLSFYHLSGFTPRCNDWINRLQLSPAAVFGARGCVDHFQFFTSHDVITLLGNHAHDSTAGRLLGPIYQQLQF